MADNITRAVITNTVLRSSDWTLWLIKQNQAQTDQTLCNWEGSTTHNSYQDGGLICTFGSFQDSAGHLLSDKFINNNFVLHPMHTVSLSNIHNNFQNSDMSNQKCFFSILNFSVPLKRRKRIPVTYRGLVVHDLSVSENKPSSFPRLYLAAHFQQVARFLHGFLEDRAKGRGGYLAPLKIQMKVCWNQAQTFAASPIIFCFV